MTCPKNSNPCAQVGHLKDRGLDQVACPQKVFSGIHALHQGNSTANNKPKENAERRFGIIFRLLAWPEVSHTNWELGAVECRRVGGNHLNPLGPLSRALWLGLDALKDSAGVMSPGVDMARPST